MSLRAESLAFGWPDRIVGRDLWLELTPGSVGFLLGPNGTGKTTLLKTLLGLLPAQGGVVSVNGAPLATLSRAEIARAIAYVPQVQPGYFPFSALETVLMGRTAHLGLLASPGKADRELALQALARLGIGALAGRAYTRLSGGEQQLVRIARALAQGATTLVLDEPTAALDLGNAQRVLDVLRALADAGHAILITSHDPNHAFAIGDSAMLMKGGEIVARGAPKEAIDAASLREVYGVQAIVAEVGEGMRVSVAVPRR